MEFSIIVTYRCHLSGSKCETKVFDAIRIYTQVCQCSIAYVSGRSR